MSLKNDFLIFLNFLSLKNDFFDFFEFFSYFFSLFPQGQILAMDLSYIRKVRRQKRTAISAQTKPTIILVLLDIFSRFCQLRILPDQRAITVQQAIREALSFFLPVTRKSNNYSHFLTDLKTFLLKNG